MIAFIVHGGAGEYRPELRRPAQLGCEQALDLGCGLLREGASALDAVEKAIMALEDNPVFNSGTGSNLNADGEVEMDGLIVDGATLEFGSVTGLRHVKNPIAVARMVMEKTPHCMLAGEGATRFAHGAGCAFVATDALAGDGGSGPEHGTVGAVALDVHGHVAAGTSTGGTRDKLAGRVGDSPLIGCGAVADDAAGGASATGWGESLMKVMMARTAAEFMKGGRTPSEAAVLAVEVLKARGRGRGGVICVDPAGGIGWAFNTPHLAVAYMDRDGKKTVAV